VYVEDAKGKRVLLAEGYEIERRVAAEEDGKTVEWRERVIIAHSETYAKTLKRGLEQRLSRATAELHALTPAPARGKRQIRDESVLVAAAEAILKARNVVGLLNYTFERQEKRQIRYVGRGRGNPNRPTRETQYRKTCYLIPFSFQTRPAMARKRVNLSVKMLARRLNTARALKGSLAHSNFCGIAYDRINNGRIQVVKNADTGLYLFPDEPATLEMFKDLKDGNLKNLRFS
jgi:hypothetical protein